MAESPWRPMSEAPKDGTPIFVRHATASVVRWQWNGDNPEDGGCWFNDETQSECDDPLDGFILAGLVNPPPEAK